MRVLIVEDDIRLARMIKRALEDEGHVADMAVNGDVAMQRVEGASYDAVLLDVMLPGADGFSVCRSLRAADVWAPVLMLTARDSVEDRVNVPRSSRSEG